MQRVQQNQLLQSTNQALLKIRQAELNYYVSFYLTFGGQATLIAGFAFEGLTQIEFPQPPPDNPWHLVAKDLFWIAGACTLGAAIHCILSSIFLQIFGPGLALYGPVGSVNKATNGMRREVNSVFTVFIIMTACFACSIVASFWVTMSLESAIFGTTLFFISGLLATRSCFRIANRFNWYAAVGLQEMEGEADDMAKWQLASTKAEEKGKAESKLDSGNEGVGMSFHGESPGPPLTRREQETRNAEVLMKGYLLTYIRSPRGGRSRLFLWDRRFFVILSPSWMLCYASREAYSTNERPQYSRPIDLSEYRLVLGDPDDDEDSNSNNNGSDYATSENEDSRSAVSSVSPSQASSTHSTNRRAPSVAGSKKTKSNRKPARGSLWSRGSGYQSEDTQELYRFSLVPLEEDAMERPWKFRCDSHLEHEEWTDLLGRCCEGKIT